MHEDVDDVIAMRSAVPDGLQRMLAISFAIHVGCVVLLAVLPREWFATPAKPPMMSISLSGSPGERSTGMNPISGKQVEQVAPPPKRPEVAKPIEPARPDAMKIPAKTPAKPEPTTKPREVTPPPPTRPPTTGAQVAKGTAAAETGAVGQSTGLTFGGGAEGAVGKLDVADFCCPEFLQAMLREIRRGWNDQMPGTGVTVMKFTILRDGRIVDVVTEKSSGNGMLDIASRSAVPAKLPMPLPAGYPGAQLVVHLSFPYQR